MTTEVLNYCDKVRQVDTLCVDGYIREMETRFFGNDANSFYDKIPLDINSLCIAYYHIQKDRFDPALHVNDSRITDDTILEVDYAKYGVAVISGFLSNIVSKGIHHWQFRIKNHKYSSNCYIGIFKTKYDPHGLQHEYLTMVHSSRAIYAINGRFGELRGDINNALQNEKYCSVFKNNDIIDMYLDLNKYELRYSVNDQDCGKAMDVEQTTYRACVGVDEKEECVSLILYEHY